MATVIQRRHQDTNDNIGLYDSSEMLTVVIGFVMLILAFAGLMDKGFLGLDLSPMHCFVLAASGALAVWAGFTSEENRERAYTVDLTLGLFYLANLVAGLMLPAALKDRSVFNEGLVREIAPGFLDLRNYDHFLHGALAVIFFMSAWSCWKKMRSTGQRSYN